MTILVLGAGGMAGIGMTRSLKGFDVHGDDDSKFSRHLMEVPQMVKGWQYDMIIPVPDVLVKKYASNPLAYLPSKKEIVLCQDKAATARALGQLAPQLHWVRDTGGAGGWGAQMCSEYLPGKNYSVEFIFWRGELKGKFAKERISYNSNRINTSVIGVGNSAISTCVNEKRVFNVAMDAISLISSRPHGIYGIDLRENSDGVLKVTEINPGRFLTASYCFYYLTEYNLPRLYAELFLELRLTPLGKYPEGLSIIRQRDRVPWIGKLDG